LPLRSSAARATEAERAASLPWVLTVLDRLRTRAVSAGNRPRNAPSSHTRFESWNLFQGCRRARGRANIASGIGGYRLLGWPVVGQLPQHPSQGPGNTWVWTDFPLADIFYRRSIPSAGGSRPGLVARQQHGGQSRSPCRCWSLREVADTVLLAGPLSYAGCRLGLVRQHAITASPTHPTRTGHATWAAPLASARLTQLGAHSVDCRVRGSSSRSISRGAKRSGRRMPPQSHRQCRSALTLSTNSSMVNQLRCRSSRMLSS
jgi:hypothetical protein